MDFNSIQELITSLGFPIVCVLCLSWFVYKMWNSSREDMKVEMERIIEDSKQREEKLNNQIDKFSESLNNFNLTLTKIETRLEDLSYPYNKKEE